MDSYLESLTKKSAEVVKETVEEEIKEPIDEIAEEIVEEDVEAASSVDPEEYEEAIAEAEAEEETAEEETAEEEVAEETAEEVEEPEPEVKKEAPVVKRADIPNTGEVISVIDIKVYNVPDVKQPFKIISGNVVYLGEVDGFAIIDYMKPGFGVVKGYTTDLK